MLFVLVGWVLFRSPDFTTAGTHADGNRRARQRLRPQHRPPQPGAGWSALAASVLVPSTQRLVEGGWLQPVAYQAVGLAVLLVACILAVGQGQPTAFIYFQF